MIALIAKKLSIPSLDGIYTWSRAGNQDVLMAMYLFQATLSQQAAKQPDQQIYCKDLSLTTNKTKVIALKLAGRDLEVTEKPMDPTMWQNRQIYSTATE